MKKLIKILEEGLFISFSKRFQMKLCLNDKIFSSREPEKWGNAMARSKGYRAKITLFELSTLIGTRTVFLTFKILVLFEVCFFLNRSMRKSPFQVGDITNHGEITSIDKIHNGYYYHFKPESARSISTLDDEEIIKL